MDEDSLVRRRSRRSNFGNRLEAVLAEETVAEIAAQQDAEDDEDWELTKAREQEDVFEADFDIDANSDEEAAKVNDEGGEKAAQEEEKREKRAARTRVERATAAAHARQKRTFNPEADTPASDQIASSQRKTRRRVTLGPATDAESSRAARGGYGAGAATRHSQRRHTMLSTSATAERIRDAEKRVAPKKVRAETKVYTQDELIARALDTEEGNIIEHRDYLSLEEEKRRKARVVRPHIEGPVLRWISRGEPTKTDSPSPARRGIGSSLSSRLNHAIDANEHSLPKSLGSDSSSAAVPGSYPYPVPDSTTLSSPLSSSAIGATVNKVDPQPKQHDSERIARNYVIHELGQKDHTPLPMWDETMQAMFGDHVKWKDLKVYVNKGRPFSRPVQSCPLTGLSARYLDPRTNVPFANVKAYQALTGILNHEYVWSDALGCYVAREGERAAGDKAGA
ncbi:hypothetical protein PUNSTDRAFT_139878 [Punctularia strigosozonata HHB-11173 SS5]|uniref:uncharacterized protein n=1 Tax=Punctularia strigosozonata (strain HHB-11173) TaxID=741275 RepID=UPI0004417812|nr:uncharacterized protein PUNSTDRAFT_139878 [Punctularia strigosozonata HHB-11173 SS5]EIN13281.1 hypothetical protein PUNSTDRAFT_139878 [Punctularia strigosozonata HHB-11173 SS5]